MPRHAKKTRRHAAKAKKTGATGPCPYRGRDRGKSHGHPPGKPAGPGFPQAKKNRPGGRFPFDPGGKRRPVAQAAVGHADGRRTRRRLPNAASAARANKPGMAGSSTVEAAAVEKLAVTPLAEASELNR